jgi:uncharacterized repeat protein (TIGR01451 family)
MLSLSQSAIRLVRTSVILASLFAAAALSACSDAREPASARAIAPTEPSATIVTTGALTVTPASLDFGTVLLGASSASRSVVVTNTGTGPLTLTSAYGFSAGDFLPVNTNADCVLYQPIQPGDQCTFTWQFTPIAVGSRSGYQEILSDGGNVNVQFTGTSYSSADVAVSIGASSTTAQAGKTLTYTIAVTNLGPGNATGIALSDILPPMTTFASISNSTTTTVASVAGSATPLPCTSPPVGSTGTVSCFVSWMPAGATITYQLVVNVQQKARVTAISNTATVTTTSTDPASSNDSATITIPVRGKK